MAIHDKTHTKTSNRAALDAEWAALCEAWVERFPRRAEGGRLALAGFRFQLLIFLREALGAALRSNRALQLDVLTETLADVVQESVPRAVVVTETKRTLSSGSLADALEEFWLIENLAREIAPSIANILEFRVIASSRKLAEATDAVERWSKAAAVADPSRALVLETFRRHVTVAVEPLPYDRLLELTANELEAPDPVALIDRWVGLLVNSTSSRETLKQACQLIWSDITNLQRSGGDRRPRAVHLVTADDHAPSEVRAGDVLDGQQPQLGHLRAGYFAERPSVVDPLVDAVHDWLSRAQDADDLRVPIFWVGGRSGSGKSVALLQLVAEVYQEGVHPILWIGNKAEALADAASWGREIARGQQWLIAVDDPYQPVAEGNAFATWARLLVDLEGPRQRADIPEIPRLLCCGPTEQAHRLQRAFPDDIRVTLIELPHEHLQALDDLREWYVRRTGRRPPEYAAGADVLLVQLFFEWNQGRPLSEFAARFKRRVEQLDGSGGVQDALSTLLALNRLYVGLPARALEEVLSPTQRDALEALVRDEHLRFDPKTGRTAWLAHPHLANAIYEWWYPASASTAERERHIEQGVLYCAKYGTGLLEQSAPIWALSTTISERTAPDLLRLDDAARKRVLERAYVHIQDELGRIPTTMAAAWIRAAGVVSGLQLKPHPASVAVDDLSGGPLLDDDGVALAAVNLLEHLSSLPDELATRAPAVVEDLLRRSRLDSRLWAATWERAWAQSKRVTLGQLALEWLRREPANREAWSRIWRELRRQRSAYESELDELGFRWLQASTDTTTQWLNVWSALWQATRDQRVAKIGIAAVRELDKRELKFIWRVLTELLAHSAREEVLEAAAETLGRIPFYSWAWPQLWTRIWKVRRTAELQKAGMRWLNSGANDRPGWTWIWPRMFEEMKSPALVELGIKWLENAESDAADWGYIWEPLWKHEQSERLRAHGLAFLRNAHATNGSWPFVWTALWTRDPSLELRSRGLAWLQQTPVTHGSWPIIWEALWDQESSDELRRLGLFWLDRAEPKNTYWQFIWSRLWNQPSATLQDLGREWLQVAPKSHRSWHYVWTALRDHGLRSELRQVGIEWLQQASRHWAWQYVWMPLWREESTPELRELGEHYLSRIKFSDPSWGYVWQELWRDERSHQLSALGHEWLTTTKRSHGSWAFVWEDLWSYTPTGELKSLAREWLVSTSKHRSWAHVWTELWKAEPTYDLSGLGLDWLRANQRHGSWAYVWTELWKVEPTFELHNLAVGWLRANPRNGSWTYVWQALESHDDYAESLDLLLGWLGERANFGHTLWQPLWTRRWTLDRGNDGLRAVALDWLRGHRSQRGWEHLWLQVWDATPDEDLRTLGLHWLHANRSQGGWEHVWLRLWHAKPNDDLRGLGLERLSVRPPPAGWEHVWLQLWHSVPEDDLESAAMEWLAETITSARSWHAVWFELWRSRDLSAATRVSLEELGVRWLRSTQNHGTWGPVWLALYEVESARGLERRAEQWLKKTLGDGQWLEVWKVLWRAGPSDRLRTLAQAWAMSIPPDDTRRALLDAELGGWRSFATADTHADTQAPMTYVPPDVANFVAATISVGSATPDAPRAFPPSGLIPTPEALAAMAEERPFPNVGTPAEASERPATPNPEFIGALRADARIDERDGTSDEDALAVDLAEQLSNRAATSATPQNVAPRKKTRRGTRGGRNRRRRAVEQMHRPPEASNAPLFPDSPEQSYDQGPALGGSSGDRRSAAPDGPAPPAPTA